MSDTFGSALKRSADHKTGQGAVEPFSPKGFERLRACIEEYIEAVTAEAHRVAMRARADTVSSAHVDEAARYLLALRGRHFFRHLGTIGGILLGTGISQVTAMLSGEKMTPSGVALSAGFGIVGAFLVALHVAKD